MQMPKKVILITDGACIGNPGPGGWACILRYGEHKKELYGSEAKTTNNRMELKAVIAGLSALKEPCAVLVTTDSKYVKQGLTEWLERWKKRSWTRKVKGLPGNSPLRIGIFGNNLTPLRVNTQSHLNG